MTTTTKTANGNRGKDAAASKAPIGDGWDDVPKAGGANDNTPEWCPQLRDLKEEAQEQSLSLKPEGSHCRDVVTGQPVIQEAFGEPRYFLKTADVPGGLLALPTHGGLTSRLDKYTIGDVAVMRIAVEGKGRARPNQQAPFLYDVRAKGADGKGVHPLTEPRKDALLPIHKANKAKRGEQESD